MVQFSLLRVIFYYNLTDQVWYVYSIYNLHSYGELSIYVFFMLLRDTPTGIYMLIL